MDDEESSETRPKFGELLETELFSDFTVTCTDRIFKVHKAILYAHSSYFRDILTSDFKEAHTNILDLPADEPTAIEHLVHYLYNTENSTLQLKSEQLIYLFALADKYRIYDLCASVVSELEALYDNDGIFDPDSFDIYLFDANAFVATLRAIVDCDAGQDWAIWDVLIPAAVEKAPDLLKHDGFKELLQESPMLTHKMLQCKSASCRRARAASPSPRKVPGATAGGYPIYRSIS